jgi:1-acyl-sn-glycerol-3-phosphate acyltransferase
MHKTMYNTFIIKNILNFLFTLFLKLTGWKVSGELPNEKKFVMIAAPHTSNWDLPYMLAICFCLKARIYWMGKAQIFKFPFKHLMKWMGGIPVDRSQSTNMVEATSTIIKETDEIIVTVPPEGTRSAVKYWKTGFYHIAVSANVPIALGFLDYKNKVGGVGGVFYPTGNLEKDMLDIKAFYKDIKGKGNL